MDFWEMKSNLRNKPTLKNKTIIVLEYIKKKYKLTMGMAIEKIFYKEIDFKEEEENLRKEKIYEF